MKAISVSELKANPSRYLRMVRRGGEVQILSRGRPVARLVGLAEASESGWTDRRARLLGEGLLRLGGGKLERILERPPLELPGTDLSGALQEERGDRL